MVKKSKSKEVELSIEKTLSNFYTVDNQTKKINEVIGKKLYKRAATIYWLNIVIFVILCIPTFLFFVSPLIIWLAGIKFEHKDFVEALKTAMIIGLPVTIVTALYGGLIFWALMTKVRKFSQNNHRIFVYMGITSLLLCIDDHIVTEIKNGYLMDPNLTYNINLGKGEICQFKLIKKFKFEITFGWTSDKTRTKY